MRRPVTALTLLATAALSVGGLAIAPAGTADTIPYSVQTLHFKVGAGPEGTCDVGGDLYTPNAATSTSRVPAILTTNGFGGSKDDQAGLGRYFASNGYVVLAYSG